MTALVAGTALLAGCGGGSGSSAGAPSLRAAEAAVRARGYFPVDESAYDPRASVATIVGVRKGSADASAQRAFFFADGRLAGTDTRSDSARIRVAFSRVRVIALQYALYRPRDPQCCPTAGSTTVRYRWDGERMRPLDPIPPSSYSVGGSRR